MNLANYSDKGSLIGRYWYCLLKKYKPYYSERKIENIASILTRGIIGSLVCLTAISIPIITGHWLSYIICSIGIISVYAGLSWRGLGNFAFLKKNLTVSEFITYLIIGISIPIIIFF